MRPRFVTRCSMLMFSTNVRSLLRHVSMVTALMLALGTSLQLQAQTPAVSLVPVITTVAGNGTSGYNGDNITAADAELNFPMGVAVDLAGNLYVADYSNNRIRKVTPAGVITTIVGSGTQGYSGDGGPASTAQLSGPYGIVMDGTGNLYIADQFNNRIRKVASDGTITTAAGNGTMGFSGDGGPATIAELNQPFGVALDAAGNLYIADNSNHIRKVTPGGTITTVAGNGLAGYNGDNIAATSAELWGPTGVAVDSIGNIYIADGGNARVRKVTPDGIITTVAGNGNFGYLGPTSVAVDGAGNLYITDGFPNSRIREITPGGIITTVAGNGTSGYSGDGVPATSAELDTPDGVTVDGAGNLYIADQSNHRIRKVSGAAAPMNFPQMAVGSASASQNVLLAVNSSLTISSISVAQSQGGKQEFTLGTITGCAADGVTTNVAGGVCTVPVTFQPGYPGLRQMPLVVQTSVGLFQFALQGTGTGPMVAFGPGIISTVAGYTMCAINAPDGCYNGDNIAANRAELNEPSGVAVDSVGNLYIADVGGNRVRKVTPGGIITTVAGNGTAGYNGDNIPATSATLSPSGVAVDGAGNLYIADQNNDRIRKVAPGGIITTVAGNGTLGYNGDNIPATSASINPRSIAVDGVGNLYIADQYNNRIRKVTPDGAITTLAGNGTQGYNGDNIAATSAELNGPSGVAVDGSGNLYIAEWGNDRIRKVAPGGTITTLAGNGTAGYNGDNIPATSASINPQSIAVDGAGNTYIADAYGYNDGRLRKVTPDGTISTVFSSSLFFPDGVAVDVAGNLYIAGMVASSITKVDVSDPPLLTFASTNVGGASAAQDVTVLNLGNAPLDISQISIATNFSLGGSDSSCNPKSQTLAPAASCVLGVEFNPVVDGNISGSVVLTDNALNTSAAVQIINLQGSGTSSSEGSQAVAPTLTSLSPASATAGGAAFALTVNGTNFASGAVVNWNGSALATIYVSATQLTAAVPANLIATAGSASVMVTTSGGTSSAITFTIQAAQSSGTGTGIITTVAGNGTQGYSGDGGPATSAELNLPYGVAVDTPGNLYIADWSNNLIRKVTPGGTITTVAGNGTAGYSGDSGPATSAELKAPTGVAVDASGNLYISDNQNNRIRKITPDGTITTVAGNGTAGYSGDGGPATSAELENPDGVVVDVSGNLYISDWGDGAIRKVTPDGTITTVAGNATRGYSGDGGPATSAEFNAPHAAAVDASGNLYIADEFNNRIRKVTPGGTVTTVAGNGTQGYSGDGGPATSAELNNPVSVAVDASGNLYIGDIGNNCIRKVTPDGTITTVAGNGYGAGAGVGGGGYSGDGGPATSAELNYPIGVAVDASGNLYIADAYNQRVRKVASGSGGGLQSQMLTFPNPGPQTYGMSPITLTATVSSGLPVSYTVISGSAAVSGSTLTITGAGLVTVQASQAGNDTYAAATPVSISFTVTANLASQTITFPNPGTQSYSKGSIVLSATASSGLAVSYAVISGPATVSGNTLMFTGAGSVTVQATQLGNAYYTAASPVSVTFTVTNLTATAPTMSPAPYTYSTPQSVTLADASTGVSIYYTTDGSTPTTASKLYAGPIAVSTTTTIQAIAVGNGYAASSAGFGIYKITAVAPTMSPAPYTYNTPQTVTLTDVSPGVSIYYTTDGSTPTTASKLYTGPITVSTTTTIQAIAVGNGYAASSTGFGIYKIVAAAPTMSPAPYTYSTPQTVTLTDVSPGVSIYYTTDGSTPTTASKLYAGPITVSTTTTIQAIAVSNGYAASSAGFGIYKIVAAAPTMSPAPYTYSTPQTVTLTDVSPGVSIYYTTDGSTPTTASKLYTGPIAVSTTTTIQAIALGNGYAASSAGFGIYRITAH